MRAVEREFDRMFSDALGCIERATTRAKSIHVTDTHVTAAERIAVMEEELIAQRLADARSKRFADAGSTYSNAACPIGHLRHSNNSCFMDSLFAAMFTSPSQFLDNMFAAEIAVHSDFQARMLEVVNMVRGTLQQENMTCDALRQVMHAIDENEEWITAMKSPDDVISFFSNHNNVLFKSRIVNHAGQQLSALGQYVQTHDGEHLVVYNEVTTYNIVADANVVIVSIGERQLNGNTNMWRILPQPLPRLNVNDRRILPLVGVVCGWTHTHQTKRFIHTPNMTWDRDELTNFYRHSALLVIDNETATRLSVMHYTMQAKEAVRRDNHDQSVVNVDAIVLTPDALNTATAIGTTEALEILQEHSITNFTTYDDTHYILQNIDDFERVIKMPQIKTIMWSLAQIPDNIRSLVTTHNFTIDTTMNSLDEANAQNQRGSIGHYTSVVWHIKSKLWYKYNDVNPNCISTTYPFSNDILQSITHLVYSCPNVDGTINNDDYVGDDTTQLRVVKGAVDSSNSAGEGNGENASENAKDALVADVGDGSEGDGDGSEGEGDGSEPSPSADTPSEPSPSPSEAEGDGDGEGVEEEGDEGGEEEGDEGSDVSSYPLLPGSNKQIQKE